MTSFLLQTGIMSGFVILQSVVFSGGILKGEVPDIALIILCFSAHHYGSFRGEIGGFISGVVLDTLSLAPLGFHAFIRSVIGFLFGSVRGKLFIDPILVPVLMISAATLFKALVAFLLASVFAPDAAGSVFSTGFGIELGMNALVAPFLFALMKSIGMIRSGRERVGYE